MNELAVIPAAQTSVGRPAKAPVPIGDRGIVINDLDALWQFSTIIASSGLAPKGLEKVESIFVSVQMGLEVGLTPMAALQNISPINGRPTIWGDAQLAIVRNTGELEEFDEWYEVAGKRIDRNPTVFADDTTGVCRVKRKGHKPKESAFSVADAKRANLWGKPGPWSQYPARMLRFRARSFGLRDDFGDALKGMRTTEEAIDHPTAIDIEEAAPRFVPPEPPKGLPEAPPVVTAAAPAAQPETAKKPRASRKEQPAAPPPPTEPPADPPADPPFDSPARTAEPPPALEPDPVPEGTPPETGPTLTKNQADLKAFVLAEGSTFERFRDAMVKTTWFAGSEQWQDFHSVPEPDAARMLGAKHGVRNQLKKYA